MPNIGEHHHLAITREKPFGVYLDGGGLGEILLPTAEIPPGARPGDCVDVFLYTDSEDRPIATTTRPKVMPGHFGKLKCVDVNSVGAFLDWGLPKDLFVPFREQKSRMEPGKSYLVRVFRDEASNRIAASTRLTQFLDQMSHRFRPGDEVELIISGKTDLGYKAIINETFSGLLFHDRVFQPLQPGERLKGHISDVRPDGKIDLSLHPEGRARVAGLEETILAELRARGGFWPIGDFSSAAEIHEELGVSKRTFKQTVGALLKKRAIQLSERGLHLP